MNFGFRTSHRKYTTPTQAMNRMMHAIDIQATTLLGCLAGFCTFESLPEGDAERTPETPAEEALAEIAFLPLADVAAPIALLPADEAPPLMAGAPRLDL